MNQAKSSPMIRITVAVTFMLMIIVNALANILPINGRGTGEVSDAYENLFAPAGITFSIWGVIYLLLAAYTLYQFGLFHDPIRVASAVSPALLDKVGTLFTISSLANVAWIFSWHYDMIPLSVLFMLIILACLILISLDLRKTPLTAREALFVRVPFSVYFGWITVATIANITTLLVYLDWNGFGLPETVWTIVVLAAGILIGVATMVRNRDIAYGLVLIWAYFGIWTKHTSADGFAGQYPIVIYAALAGIAIFVIAEIFTLVKRRRTVD